MNGHKREDIVEYKKISLNKIKTLLSYFIEFNKNSSISLKVYPKDYIVDCLNKGPIMMIKHNKNIFLANNGQQKV